MPRIYKTHTPVNVDWENLYSHTDKSFRNLIKSNRNQIVFTIFWLIRNRTDVRLVPNQSEKSKYNLISVLYNKISKIFLCVTDSDLDGCRIFSRNIHKVKCILEKPRLMQTNVLGYMENNFYYLRILSL